MNSTSHINLSLAIATHGAEGIHRVEAMNLPQIPGVEYVVSWQRSDDLPLPPALTSRSDVQVTRYNGDTLSGNRNNAADRCSGDYILMADDDLIYTASQLQSVIYAFTTNPDADLLVMRFDGPHSWPMPNEPVWLSLPLPKRFYVTAFQLAVTRRAWQSGLRFNTAFGPGAKKFTASEDEMLLLSAIRRGLRCRYLPLTICTHPAETTGTRPITDHGVLMTMGALIAITHPRTWLPRVALNAYRTAKRRRASFPTALMHITVGALHLKLHRKQYIDF